MGLDVYISFMLLLFSHIMMLIIGWHMGAKADQKIIMSKPTKKKKKPEIYKQPPDVFDEEAIDVE